MHSRVQVRGSPGDVTLRERFGLKNLAFGAATVFMRAAESAGTEAFGWAFCREFCLNVPPRSRVPPAPSEVPRDSSVASVLAPRAMARRRETRGLRSW